MKIDTLQRPTTNGFVYCFIYVYITNTSCIWTESFIWTHTTPFFMVAAIFEPEADCVHARGRRRNGARGYSWIYCVLLLGERHIMFDCYKGYNWLKRNSKFNEFSLKLSVFFFVVRIFRTRLTTSSGQQ